MPRLPRALLVLVAAAIAGWLLYALWPSEERRVLRRLGALEEVINDRPRDGLAMVARTAQLSKFVEEDIVLEPGRGAGAIHGRERLIALASRAPNAGGAFALRFVDESVTVNGRQALVRLTATLSWIDGRGEENVDAREVELALRKSDDWRIARVTAINALEKPQP